MSPLLELTLRAALQCSATPPLTGLHDPPPAIPPILDNSPVNVRLASEMYTALVGLGYTDADALHWLGRDGTA